MASRELAKADPPEVPDVAEVYLAVSVPPGVHLLCSQLVLDNFARNLRSQGVPAVSVGLGMISEVVYLHEKPELEALLLRKGIQAIDSDELLQIVALTRSSSSSMGTHHAHDTLAAAHLLTDLEASGLKELRKKGFDGTNPTWDDPRATSLLIP
ncbi:hypothetical protein DL766_003576 [Monosporascus sp. MC13-8B]|uniref:Uncharacterized protein n=1 Tax=Monosporascus cannonballus TaxID=155416 RepID=A0ABY0H8E0_9PEZI|nr:hypothetical protein DL763_006811 [Monosporascus cannonballus]RYO87557.1 hypothetical protein DL762_004203 [Monosporascus cannonballus]RYP33271.1 hypothetical protein DL766_003576 [Monosporascus sp. MC13-8B]